MMNFKKKNLNLYPKNKKINKGIKKKENKTSKEFLKNVQSLN